MDTIRAAKFPFLREAKEFVDSQHIEMADLITSENLLPARKRGIQRVLEALDKGMVEYRPLMNDYDRLMEVMSYPYARMLVSQVDDRYLTKRYALGEAVRMNQNLNDEKRNMTTLLTVSGELGVEALGNDTGIVRMKFTDFLMLAGRLKSKEWKLINNDVRSGMVHLPAEKF
ncbi:MAG: DNA primase, partial [Candidatus Methanomethylophilaceae archaeon]|nr:DNA primase [Candidatus Methanomethylophilaceae archaeon]